VCVILILSDLFSGEQWQWMYQLFLRMIQEVFSPLSSFLFRRLHEERSLTFPLQKDQIEDFMLHFYLLTGITKAMAVNEQDCRPVVTPLHFSNLFRQALDSNHQSAHLAALNALLVLIEGDLTKAHTVPLRETIGGQKCHFLIHLLPSLDFCTGYSATFALLLQDHPLWAVW